MVQSNSPEQLKLRLQNAFPQPAFDDSWLDPEIIRKTFKSPDLLAKKPVFGTDVNTCTNYIIEEIYPTFSMHDGSEGSKVSIWVDWVNACASLWALIGTRCGELNREADFSLLSLSTTACFMIPEAARAGNNDLQMLEDTMSSLTILTLWFLEEYHWYVLIMPVYFYLLLARALNRLRYILPFSQRHSNFCIC